VEFYKSRIFLDHFSDSSQQSSFTMCLVIS
jgi:hypothetical protein